MPDEARTGEQARQLARTRLRDAILRGEMAPAQRLVENEPADAYGVTRAGIRAALIDLAAEGLVERIRNRGSRVRVVSVGEAVAPKEARMTPPPGGIARLGHVELLTPEPERSLWYFTTYLGLAENGRAGDSVYLRTWDDYEHHSLVLTAAPAAGVRRTALRTSSEEALRRRGRERSPPDTGVGGQRTSPGSAACT